MVGFKMFFKILIPVLIVFTALFFGISGDHLKVANFFFCIGAVSTSLTIWMIYRQTLAASRPDIYPQGGIYSISEGNQEIDFTNESNLPIVRLYKYEINSVEDKSIARIYLHNIGLGAATKITCEWIYDSIKVEELIANKYYTDKSTELKTKKIGFIPAEKTAAIFPPIFYFQCWGDIIYDDTLQDSPPNNMPSLQLNLTFQDIHATTYKRLFNVIIEKNIGVLDITFEPKQSS